MCARYEFSKSGADIIRGILEEAAARGMDFSTGTVCPGDTPAVIACSRKLRPTAFPMHWGYRMTDGRLIINARSESAAEKPLFAEGLRQRRCLIPAEAYYEWENTPAGRQKYIIRPRGSGSFCLAGIYRLTGSVPEFTVLTREPATSIAFIHDRMPVILPEEVMSDWLDPRIHGRELLDAAVLDMVCTLAEPVLFRQLSLLPEA